LQRHLGFAVLRDLRSSERKFLTRFKYGAGS